MEQTIKKYTDGLNDLILIHNDRIADYTRAIDDLDENDFSLKSLLSNFIDQSVDFKMKLKELILQAEKEINSNDNETTIGGKLHRAWADMKSAFTNGNKKVILESCESTEDSVQEAYKNALMDEYLPSSVRDILLAQKDMLEQSHNTIKNLEDEIKE